MASSDHRRLHGVNPVFVVQGINAKDLTDNYTVTYNGSYGTFTNQKTSLDLDGTDDVATVGDIGNIRTIAFWVKPDTTTQELILVDTGKDIMVDAGTITYTGLTADATYVDASASTTLVAGAWQHVVCVLNALVDANTFKIGTDGSNFGAAEFYQVRAYTFVPTLDEIKALMTYTKVH